MAENRAWVIQHAIVSLQGHHGELDSGIHTSDEDEMHGNIPDRFPHSNFPLRELHDTT